MKLKESFLANLEAAKNMTKEIKAVYKEINQIITMPVYVAKTLSKPSSMIKEEILAKQAVVAKPKPSKDPQEAEKSALNSLQKNSFEVSISEYPLFKEYKKPNSSLPVRKPVQFGSFFVLRKLGSGSSGCTYLCIDKKTNFLFAIKQINMSYILENEMEEQVKRQAILHNRLSHPAIVDLFCLTFDQENVFLVMQSLIKKEGQWKSERQASITSGQVADALSYLHSQQLIYRDLKPENIVLNVFDIAKLVDFGQMIEAKDKPVGLAGTLEFIAPEVLRKIDFDTRSDMWSLGVLSYELLVGQSPFNIQSLKEAIAKAKQPECFLYFPAKLSKNAISWMTGLLQKDPAKRMTSEVALKHPFLQEYREWRKNQ